MEQKEKKTKGRIRIILGNIRFEFFCLKENEGWGAVIVCLAEMVLGAVLPFMAMALPSVVVALLTAGIGIENICKIVCYAGLLQALNILYHGYLSGGREQHLFLMRLGMGKAFYGKCLDVDVQFLESAAGQEKIQNACTALMSGNEQGVEKYLVDVLDIGRNLLGLFIYSLIIFGIAPYFLPLLVLQTVLVAFLHGKAGEKEAQLEKENQGNWRGAFYMKKESILAENGKDIRLYRMGKWFTSFFYQVIDNIAAVCDKERTNVMKVEIVETILTFVRDLLIYGYLIWQMGKGVLSVAEFLLYTGMAAGFGTWMNGLFNAFVSFLQNNVHVNAYRDFLGTKSLDAGRKEKPLHPRMAHEIRLEHVSFRYEGMEEDTLSDISLTIRAGERLALVGRNGAGKTTLVKLLCGLYYPTGGRILMDGQDISKIAPEEYFKEFAVVFQDIFSFSFSVADNVSCKEPEHTDDKRLKDSLSKAGLWEKISTLPKGVNTMINKDMDGEGISFSGGEQQKLMLARALYCDAPFVILDEPTAALDPIAEGEMYEKYESMLQNKTGVFISHRLSSTRFCDRILFLEKGHIAEEGSHEELMKKQGAYAEMFSLQAKYYQEEMKD